MELIEPSHFDAVVITSGLPEVLIASALARAGKSVLVLDAADNYGASWSSLSGRDYVHCLANRHLKQQQLQSQQEQYGSGVADAFARQQQAAHLAGPQAATMEQCPAADGGDSDHNLSVIELQAVQPLASLHGSAALYIHPQVKAALADKQLVIDLAPKVLYQDELLVQLLVSCQAHNYLEFKLVEGSYIYQKGRLVPVPASRADLFADKSLSLPDKRSLGRFLTACMEAQQGYGRLKDCFDSRPLIELLASEGLSDTLQQVVMYGIAMADTPQQQQQGQHAADPVLEAAVEGTARGCTVTSKDSPPVTLLTAAEGLAALQLYMSSLGRYGGTGAFMAPCYGCGSLPEAFVRLAAVKGAVTALRHGAQKLVLMSEHTQQQRQRQQQQHVVGTMPAKDHDGNAAEGSASASFLDPQSTGAEAPAVSAQVVLTSGQTITANTVVSCQEALKAPITALAADVHGAAQAHSCSTVAHAVVLLDSSLVDGDNSLLLVFPPGSLGHQQTTVVRGLQCGPALAVTPPGKYLLYLSTPLPPGHSSPSDGSKVTRSEVCTAQQILGPAVRALGSTEGLEALRFGVDHEAVMGGALQPTQQEQVQEGAQSDTPEKTYAGRQLPQQEQEQQLPRQKPQVLALCYHTSQQAAPQCCFLHQQQQQQGVTNVLWCQSASAGYTGYNAMIRATEAVYRQQFPNLPWLADQLMPQGPQHAAATTAAAAAPTFQDAGSALGATQAAADVVEQAAALDALGSGGLDADEDNEAIDELTAALAELSAV